MDSCLDLIWNIILLLGFLAGAAVIMAIIVVTGTAGASLLALLSGPVLALLFLGLLVCALARGG